MMDWELRLRQQYAISVRREWLEQVLAQLRAAHPDFAAWPEDRVFEKVFTAFLFCDLNQAGAAALPANTKDMHKEVLAGKFVLQLDEVVNMAAAARERYSDQAGRCLKFALTDGCQQIIGVEHAHLPTFSWDCPAGGKVLIHNVPIRRGLLLLGPDNTALLGGQVERLEGARQRAVAAWNKPVVGRPAGSDQRDIFAEARQAAWAPCAPEAAVGGGGGAAVQGALAGSQAQGAARQATPPAGSAGGEVMGSEPGAAGPPAQHRHPAQHLQVQNQNQPPPQPSQQAPAAQHQQQYPQQVHPQAVGNGRTHGQAPTAAAAGAAAAAVQAAGQLRPQQQPGTVQSLYHSPQHPQHGWHPQQQPPPVTQPRAPTLPPQVAGAAVEPPWLGCAAGAGAGATAASGGVTITATGGGNGGGGGGGLRAGPGGIRIVDILSSSEDSAASELSQPHACDHQSSSRGTPIPRPALRQPQPHQQQPVPEALPRRRLPPPSALGGAPLLGGSTAWPGLGLGSTTSSSGLLPPRPTTTVATVQRASPAGLPSSGAPPSSAAAAAAAGTAAPGTHLRKPTLPLARSSPGPSGSLGSIGRAGGAAAVPSPSTSTAGFSGGTAPPVRGEPQWSAGRLGQTAAAAGGAGAHSSRAPGAPMDIDMVDLASLDDDEGDIDGGLGTGPASAGAPLTGASEPGAGAGQQQHRKRGCKARQPPLDPAGRTEKRARLSPEPLGCGGAGGWGAGAGGGSDGNGGEGRPGLARGQREGAAGGGSGWHEAGASAGTGLGAAAERVPEAQMGIDLDPTSVEAAAALAEQSQIGSAGDLERRRDPPPPAAAPEAAAVAGRQPVDELTVFEADSDMADGWPGPSAGPQQQQQRRRRVSPGCAAPDEPGGFGEPEELRNHAGAVLLCQVPDLLQSDPDTGVPVTFPVTLDVMGLFHVLDGDCAVVEDGTAMLEAQLTDSALAPLLADVEPPPGFVASGPIGLVEIQNMADSADPAVQAYGTGLAEHLMDYIRDFTGLIRLEYRAPPPAQPLIIGLTNDGERGKGGAGPGHRAVAAVGPVAGSSGEPGRGCQMYEEYLQDVGALRLDSADEGAAPQG